MGRNTQARGPNGGRRKRPVVLADGNNGFSQSPTPPVAAPADRRGQQVAESVADAVEADEKAIAEAAGPSSPNTDRTSIIPIPDEVGIGKIMYEGEVINFGDVDTVLGRDLGEGTFGVVREIRHKTRDITVAVKIIRDNIREDERKSLVREVATIQQAGDCNTIVDYYGLNFSEGDVWIYMELMEIALHKLYERILPDPFPDSILIQIAISVLDGLKYLRDVLNSMHRDIKPSNLLMGFDGSFKICDFGIAKNLENSLAQSAVGCSPYLSPERINPQKKDDERYGVEADVWSYGLTLAELGKQNYPYDGIEDKQNIFSLLQAIVMGPPPSLPDRYPPEFCDFVSQCLIKEKSQRPRYTTPPLAGGKALVEHPFYVTNKDKINNNEVRLWYARYNEDAGGADKRVG